MGSMAIGILIIIRVLPFFPALDAHGAAEFPAEETSDSLPAYSVEQHKGDNTSNHQGNNPARGS